MNTSSGNPFNYSSAMAKNNGLMPNSSSRMALDNLLRRELKVSDPNDAKQIAEALLNRYKNNPRALAINKEAEGVPFLLASSTPMALQQAPTSSDAEMQQAINDVERDLRELTTNSILKDVTPELEGWAMAVRSAIQEGVNSARFALDPRQRDKAFGIRRTLGDYARMARLVGTLTPSVSMIYRKFAQSLDEVASVILVMMGEALANVGFNGGRFLLQVPYSELQVRRDAVTYALRNLTGATQEAYGSNNWPRGLDAYRRLFDVLEEQGQGELRALLLEHELTRIMDSLIQRAAQGNAEGLRHLGSTAQIELSRLRRLVIIGHRLVSPESPPLNTFLQALQLFLDAFKFSGGFRLMRIARPPILFYGLYGMSGLDQMEQRLLNLVLYRNRLADQLDCFMQCGCDFGTVQCQVVLDKILYDVDRAIDLYTVGVEDFGKPERRASAYSYIIQAFQSDDLQSDFSSCQAPNASGNGNPANLVLATLHDTLDKIDHELAKGFPYSGVMKQLTDTLRAFSQSINHELSQLGANKRWPPTKQNLLNDRKNRLEAQLTVKDPKVDLKTILELLNITVEGQEYLQGQLEAYEYEAKNLDTPTSLVNLRTVLQQELCIQQDMENRWRDLLKMMTPSCFTYAGGNPFDLLVDVIGQANAILNENVPYELCGELKIEPDLPPHFETSLDSIANDVDAIGGGREDLSRF